MKLRIQCLLPVFCLLSCMAFAQHNPSYQAPYASYHRAYRAKTHSFIQIDEFKIERNDSELLFKGELSVRRPGVVRSAIELKDGRGHTYQVINLGFTASHPGRYPMSHEISLPIRSPVRIAEWRVFMYGEFDSRIKSLDEYLQGTSNIAKTSVPTSNGVFGSSKENPFVFQGLIYYLPPGTKRLPDFNRLRPVGRIYNAVLNITPRRFDQGFPGITNRFEWFAIRYWGKMNVTRPGTYTFSLLSDDGARLFIDRRLVIDNDGTHPPREQIGSIYLTKGMHEIEVQYFQGPRYEVALVLSLMENGKKRPFDIRAFAPVILEEGRCRAKFTMGSSILFDFNSYKLKPIAKDTLDEVYRVLQGYSYKKIVIEGHTDDIGSSAYNLSLSRRRARSVANYLILHGIDARKIKIIGRGESMPRFPNDTEEHRAKNRRVEITVIKRCR